MSKGIVNFNVGGQKYQVSRSLLGQYPDTMLARSASEQWQTDPESEIFIERDGERFRSVLDYLRDGKAILPVTVAKAAVLEDMLYYGVENVDESDFDDSLIKGIQSAGGVENKVDVLAFLTEEKHRIDRERERLNRERERLSNEEECLECGCKNFIGQK